MALLPEDINQINQLIGQYFSANLQAVKLSTLPLASTLEGLHTMGVDASNNSVRVSLQFVKDATTQASDAADLADQKAAFANGKALLAIEAARAANDAAAATKPLRFIWDETRLGLKFEGDPDFVYTDLKGATGNSLEFAWNGTRLGVRVEGQPAYTEVELGGKDAYQIALALDPTIGTEEEWIQSLKQPALEAAAAADAAREAIQADLAAKAAHGYDTEPQKTLKEVDDNLVQLAGDVTPKILNQIENGNFQDNSKWTLMGGVTLSASNNEGTVTISARYYGIRQTVDCVEGDKVYWRATHKKASGGIKMGLRQPAAPYAEAAYTINRVYNEYVTISLVGTLTNMTSPWALEIREEDLTTNTIYLRDIFVLNLTQSFGAGNEPSKAEMDLLIDLVGYFEGDSLSRNDIMRWQLKMIRQNRNAIIALGGTII